MKGSWNQFRLPALLQINKSYALMLGGPDDTSHTVGRQPKMFLT